MLALILSFLVIALRALCFKLTWLWFVVPTFKVIELPFVICFGLIHAFIFLKGKNITNWTNQKDIKEDVVIVYAVHSIVTYMLVLGISFLIHLFV